jgi:hypothetical protein
VEDPGDAAQPLQRRQRNRAARIFFQPQWTHEREREMIATRWAQALWTWLAVGLAREIAHGTGHPHAAPAPGSGGEPRSWRADDGDCSAC